MLDGRLAKLKKTLDAFFKGVDQSIFLCINSPTLEPVASSFRGAHVLFYTHSIVTTNP
jgi:hypothetical protein